MRTNRLMISHHVNHRVMVVLAGMLVGLLAWAVAVVPASAHVHLESSSPAADSVNPTAPTEIRLVFDGELAPEGHSITLLGPDGAPVQLDAVQLDLNDMERRTVVVPLPSDLADGTYTVEYSALPADGHEAATGTFTFTIGTSAATPGATPGATPVATPVGTPAATPTAQSAGGATPVDAGLSGGSLLVPLAIMLVAMIVALVARRRVISRS